MSKTEQRFRQEYFKNYRIEMLISLEEFLRDRMIESEVGDCDAHRVEICDHFADWLVMHAEQIVHNACKSRIHK